MKNYIYCFLISMILISCGNGVSKDELTIQVKDGINEELQKRASSMGVTTTVNSLDLIHKGGNEYSGILKTTEEGEEHTYQVDVTADGEQVMWKIVE